MPTETARTIGIMNKQIIKNKAIENHAITHVSLFLSRYPKSKTMVNTEMHMAAYRCVKAQIQKVIGAIPYFVRNCLTAGIKCSIPTTTK